MSSLNGAAFLLILCALDCGQVCGFNGHAEGYPGGDRTPQVEPQETPERPLPVVHLNLPKNSTVSAPNAHQGSVRNATIAAPVEGDLGRKDAENVLSNQGNSKREEEESLGAVRRGFFVVLGFSVVIVAYFVFKWYRVKSNKNHPPLMVRKYGVRANRSDVEMVPLPLEDDEDDDTLFEVTRPNAR